MSRPSEIVVPIYCENSSWDTFEQIAVGPGHGDVRFVIHSGSLGFDEQAGFLVMVFDTPAEAETAKNVLAEFRDLSPVWGAAPTGEGVMLVHSDDQEIVLEDRRRITAIPLVGSWEVSQDEVERRLRPENLVADPMRPNTMGQIVADAFPTADENRLSLATDISSTLRQNVPEQPPEYNDGPSF